MPTKEIDDAVNTPGAWGKIRKGGKLTIKYGFLATSLLTPFALAVDPKGAGELVDKLTSGLGEKIMSGEIGLGGAAWEAGKFALTELTPFAWSGVPELWESIKTTTLAGSTELASALAPSQT